MKTKLVIVTLIALMFPHELFAKLSSDPYVQQWGYTDVKAYGAWDYTTGSKDVIVAVIDNGFDANHPDLKDNVWKNQKEIENNGIDDDTNGYVDDVWGWNFVGNNNDPVPSVANLTEVQKQEGIFHHGTVVAGIIGGVGDNSVAGAGINWKVRLMNIKVIDNSGSGDLVLLSRAIRYAVDNGASVINISMVGDSSEPELVRAFEYASDKGVVVVAAAGNDSRFLDATPRFPACVDAYLDKQLVLGVSAVGESHHLASFSNYGSRCIDLAAPGVHILSDMRFDITAGLPDLYGGYWNGTSFSAPFVSGAAALVKALQPSWKATEIYNTLLGTVHKTPPVDEGVYAHLFGRGLLQIDKAVVAALSGIVPTLGPRVLAPPPVAIEVVPAPAPDIKQPQSPVPPLVTPQPLPPIAVPESLGLFLFESNSGFGDMYDYVSSGLGTAKEQKNLVFFQGLESFARYKNKSIESRYGVLYFRADGYSVIRTFDKNFQRIGGFRKMLNFPSTLIFADVIGDREPEVVLAPKVADTLLFSVSDKNGNELFSVTSTQKHTGVSITRKHDAVLDKEVIAVLYKQGAQVFLDEYKGRGELLRRTELSPKTELGGLFYGDVDGDGIGEYAAFIIAEHTLWVRYYDNNGKLIVRTPIFQFLNKEEKANISFDDFDSDGKYEILANEKNGGRGVYAVFGKGLDIKFLLPLKNASTNNFFVVPFVK